MKNVLANFENLGRTDSDIGALCDALDETAKTVGFKLARLNTQACKDPTEYWLSKVATDREMVLYLCKKLGLQMSLIDTDVYDNDKYVVEHGNVTVGSGRGYGGFHCRFQFDDQGRITSHGVWE